MQILAIFMLQNAVQASLLAAGVVLLQKVARPRPALAHALWLLVLLKLLLPPLPGLTTDIWSLGWQQVAARLQHNPQWQQTVPDWHPASGKQHDGTQQTADAAGADGTVGPQVPGHGTSGRAADGLQSAGRTSGGPDSERSGNAGADSSDSETFAAEDPDLDEEGDLAWLLSEFGHEDDQPTLASELAPLAAPGQAPNAHARAASEASFWSAYGGVLCAVLAGIWISGCLWSACRLLQTTVAAGRLLWPGEAAPESFERLSLGIAREVGLKRTPRLRFSESRLAPMVWACLRVCVFLPNWMLAEHDAPLARHALAHEFAHLRRKDHWVCRLVMLADMLYWWLPTWWWVRSQIRNTADQAADGLAIGEGGSRSEYARALLAAAEKTAMPDYLLPTMGWSGHGRRLLGRRLTMIMKETSRPKLSARGWIAVTAAAMLLLPSVPVTSWGQDAAGGALGGAAPAVPAPDQASDPDTDAALTGDHAAALQDAIDKIRRQLDQVEQAQTKKPNKSKPAARDQSLLNDVENLDRDELVARLKKAAKLVKQMQTRQRMLEERLAQLEQNMQDMGGSMGSGGMPGGMMPGGPGMAGGGMMPGGGMGAGAAGAMMGGMDGGAGMAPGGMMTGGGMGAGAGGISGMMPGGPGMAGGDMMPGAAGMMMGGGGMSMPGMGAMDGVAPTEARLRALEEQMGTILDELRALRSERQDSPRARTDRGSSGQNPARGSSRSTRTRREPTRRSSADDPADFTGSGEDIPPAATGGGSADGASAGAVGTGTANRAADDPFGPSTP